MVNRKGLTHLVTGGVASILVAVPMVFGLEFSQGLIISAIGAVGVNLALRVQRKALTNHEQIAASAVKPLAIASGELQEDIAIKLRELHELAKTYERVQSPLFPAVNGVLSNLQEFFKRIQAKSDEQAARIAAVRYNQMLTSLNHALGKDYYLDIEANSELWSDPSERMEAVEKAVNATGEQVLRNIRQLNSNNDLSYQLSLDTLMRSEADLTNERAIGLQS